MDWYQRLAGDRSSGFVGKGRSFAVTCDMRDRLARSDRHGLPVGERLALYRAFHTIGLELADRVDAQRALRNPDPEPGATAIEQLIDLACEMRDYDYFRSQDPVEAAGFVVSDAAALLWATLLDRYGFPGSAKRAAPQLIRWES